MSRVRYGLVGTGHWAATVHAPALAGRDDGDLVAVWGRTPEKAAALARRFDADVAATPTELFDAVDVVAFAVPPAVQAPLAADAARAGCHLVLEKPVALDVAAADEVVAATREAGVRSVVFFTARYVPEVAAWLDTAAASGPWLGGMATWFGANAEADSPYRESAWRNEHGGMWDVGPHSLATMVPLLGPVEHVTGVRGPGDVVHLALRHAGGASSTMSLGLTLPPAAARVGAAVYGPEGWSVMPDVLPDAPVALRTAVDELLACVAEGRDHPCDVGFGRDVVEVLARAEASLA